MSVGSNIDSRGKPFESALESMTAHDFFGSKVNEIFRNHGGFPDSNEA